MRSVSRPDRPVLHFLRRIAFAADGFRVMRHGTFCGSHVSVGCPAGRGMGVVFRLGDRADLPRIVVGSLPHDGARQSQPCRPAWNAAMQPVSMRSDESSPGQFLPAMRFAPAAAGAAAADGPPG
jgi:hypothetical protein